MLYFFGGDFILILVALIVLGIIGMMPDLIEGIIVALCVGSYLYFFFYNIYLYVRYIKESKYNGTLNGSKIGLGLLISILTLFIGFYIVFYISGVINYVDNGLNALF